MIICCVVISNDCHLRKLMKVLENHTDKKIVKDDFHENVVPNVFKLLHEKRIQI